MMNSIIPMFFPKKEIRVSSRRMEAVLLVWPKLRFRRVLSSFVIASEARQSPSARE
jgi:hypothetical protein